ncbi:MAG: hypothetical protein ACOC3V_00050 [bacterium]
MTDVIFDNVIEDIKNSKNDRVKLRAIFTLLGSEIIEDDTTIFFENRTYHFDKHGILFMIN